MIAHRFGCTWVCSLAVVLLACGGTESPDTALRLRVFDCGYIPVQDLEPFSLAPDEVAVPELFVPCYLIEHPAGRLLWDAGLPPAIADDPESLPDVGLGTVRYDRPLAAQLEDLGLEPGDITHVAFSHMHFDHVGSANLFEDAILLIQKAEHAAAFAPVPTIEYFDRSLYAALEDSETVLLEGDHDVFGDGRVIILAAPGHTPGHQVLFVDLEATGLLVLSGDLYHFPESRRLRRVPQFNIDREQTLASMERVEGFLEKKGATLWIEHDFVFAKGLRKSPEYYE